MLQLLLLLMKSLNKTETPIFLSVVCSLFPKAIFLTFILIGLKTYYKKGIREKSRECHNHKPQPLPDTKRKRKPTNQNKRKSNKRTKITTISSLSSPSEVIAMLNELKKKTQEQNDTR